MKKKVLSLLLAGIVIVGGGTFLVRTELVKSLALDASFPLLNSISFITDFFRDTFQMLLSKKELINQNRELERKVELLKAQLIYMKNLEKENMYLKQITNYIDKNGSYLFITGKVIGYSPDNWNRFIIINLGYEDGIKKGDLVVANGYLLGEVYQVGNSSSSVILTSDKNFKIAGRCRKTGELVFFQGKSPEEGMLLYVKPEQDIRIGDIVETAGINKNVPTGIPIGTIKSVSYNEGDFYKDVSVSLPVNPLKVEYVVVITKRTSQKR